MKDKIVKFIKLTEYGNKVFYKLKKTMGKLPKPDLNFPELISIELSSLCNLACAHCPTHIKEFSNQTRPHSHIDFHLFNQLMNEIDKNGIRQIALHKDGEPLIHPQIIDVLARVKKNVSHMVYLTTNAQKLNQETIDALLKFKIDVINFSIGASSEQFYKKVRGKGFSRVVDNIQDFISSVSKSEWKPKIFVQIINLPEYEEMNTEIKQFKKYWKNFDVEIAIWEKLTWNIFDDNNKLQYRYPCYSLWNSFNINSNAIVTACCMDWKQELVIGNASTNLISEIWNSSELKNLRLLHMNGEEINIDACHNCNYWKWQPMLLDYPLQ